MAINFPNDPATNPGNGGQWTDPGGSGVWEVEIINGQAIWTLKSTGSGGGDGAPQSLNELTDVTLSSPQDQNVLQYNQSTGQWINAPAPTASNVLLGDLQDVDTSAGSEGDILVKQSNGNWEAKTPSNTGGIGEAPSDGTPYVRQDADWISMPNNGGGSTLNIDEAPTDGGTYLRKGDSATWVPGVEKAVGSDVSISGDNDIDTGSNSVGRNATNGQVLTFDGSKFAPADPPSGGDGSGPATTDDLAEGSFNKYFPTPPDNSNQYTWRGTTWTPLDLETECVTEIVAGTGISISSDGDDPGKDKVTITATGGGGGDSSITWEIGATGTTSYDFTGPGFPTAAANPAITVVRGQKYIFNNLSGSHPFQIQSTAGLGGTAYNDGVTRNNTIGDVEFVVPMDAPAELFYQCTANHPDMGGTIAVLENSAGGGGGGVDEAPNDGDLYARQNEAWTSLTTEQTKSWGIASTAGVAWIDGVTNIDGFADGAAVEAAGYTIVNFGSAEGDDDSVAVELPADFNTTKWFGKSDPESAGGAQTLWVNGNGYMAFQTAASATEEIDFTSAPLFFGYESGQKNTPPKTPMADIELLFGFFCGDGALDMIGTKRVGEWFVIRAQWWDDYGDWNTSQGQGAANGNYPYPPYNPDQPYGNDLLKREKNRKSSKKKNTRALKAGLMASCELWLNPNGSFRMLYGPAPENTFGLSENSRTSGRSRQNNGVYSNTGIITQVMGGALNFENFATNPLIYGIGATEDGSVNTDKMMDWYIEFVPAATPFLTDAPADGNTYGRKDGEWKVAGGGGGGDPSGYIPSHVEPQGRQIIKGFESLYPINQYRDTSPDLDLDGIGTIIRPQNASSANYTFSKVGNPDHGTEGTWSIFADGNETVLALHEYDKVYNNPWNPGFGGFRPEDLLEACDAYWYSSSGTLTNPFNSDLNANLFVFVTVRFWRNVPGALEPWQYVSVDTWLPIKVTGNPNGNGNYLKVYLDNQYLGTGEGDCQTVYDYIGCTVDELTGDHLSAAFPDGPPTWLTNSGTGYSAAIEVHTNPINQELSELGGGGGGEARSGEKKKAKKGNPSTREIEIGGPDNPENFYNAINAYRPSSGMVLTFRQDLIGSSFTSIQNGDLNVGSNNGGFGNEPFDPGAARVELSPEEQAAELAKRKAERKATAVKAIQDQEATPRAIDSTVKGKRNSSGLGWRIPNFDSQSSDPRWIQDYTVNNNNFAQYEAGTLTYDKLGLWDLFGFDSFIRVFTPNTGETLVYDAENTNWTVSSNVSVRKYGEKARDNPGYAKAMDIIEAVKNDPELKAALKAALED